MQSIIADLPQEEFSSMMFQLTDYHDDYIFEELQKGDLFIWKRTSKQLNYLKKPKTVNGELYQQYYQSRKKTLNILQEDTIVFDSIELSTFYKDAGYF